MKHQNDDKDNIAIPSLRLRIFRIILTSYALMNFSAVFAEEPVIDIRPEPLFVPVQVNVRDGKTVRRDMVYAVIDEKFVLQSYSGEDILELLDGLAEPRYLLNLEGQEWVTPAMMEESGIRVSYDSSRITSEIYVPPSIQPVSSMSLRGESDHIDLPRVKPARFSAALPFYLSLNYSKTAADTAVDTGDGAVYGINISPRIASGGYVAGGKIDTSLGEEENEITGWEAAVSRDFAEVLRLTAGTSRIDSMEFQSSDPVFGFSAEKREGIGKTFLLADRYSKNIQVETESTADIYVNGKIVSSQQIMPGRYEISDFPLVPGLNSVEIVITDIYGEKTTLSDSANHAPDILVPGEHEYGLAAGAAGDDKDMFLSRGYYRFSLTDYAGTDLYAELTGEAQMGGITMLLSGFPGFFELGGAGLFSGDFSPGNADYAAFSRYTFHSSANRWLPSAGLGATFRTERFVPPGSMTDIYEPYVPPWVFTLSMTQPLPGDSSLLAGARYTLGREDISNSAGIYAFFARRLSRQIGLRAGITADYYGDNTTLRGTVTIGSMSSDGKGNYSSTYHTEDQSLDFAASRRYSGNLGNASIGGNLNRVDMAEGTASGISGNANAGNARMEASAAASIVPEDRIFGEADRISFATRFGSGIYFADGLLGAGRPAEGSFAVIGKSNAISEGDVLVNPSAKMPEASSGLLGNAVLTPLPDYHEKIVNIELPELPMDYSLPSSSFILETGFRSGTALRIEGGKMLFGSGRIVDADGEPVSLRIMRITEKDGNSGITTFTDSDGFFYIYDLLPGEYSIELSERKESSFVLSNDTVSPFSMGDITVSRSRE